MTNSDAVVVGAGPNGLAAAVVLARAGLSVRVIERSDTIGGGARTAELTLPGFHHDICSAVHPMALASPFFQAFDLERRVEFLVPELSYAHPLDGGRAGLAWRDLARTATDLGRDGRQWAALMGPLVKRIEGLVDFTGSQLLRWPKDPLAVVAFGLRTLEQGSPAWNLRFHDEIAPAMLSGVNAHSVGRMPRLATAGAGLLLGAQAHARGWAIPVGGSQAISDAMARDIVAHGGIIETGREITDLAELPSARAVLLDVSTRSLATIARERLPAGYLRALRRFRFGDAAAKIDFALSGPIPWTRPELSAAAAVHLAGDRADLAHAEAEVARGRHPDRPYVLLSQPTTVDPSRAPEGKHVAWAYAHVPNGSTADVSEAIIGQIERFAPGFRDLILASSYRSATDLERHNPNYVGGDFSSGAVTLWQLLKRPVISPRPWRTPAEGVYLCSSATPPGTAVHGLSGYYAARTALRDRFGLGVPPLGIDE